MDRIQVLHEKIQTATRCLRELQEENERLHREIDKLQTAVTFLTNENKQVQRLKNDCEQLAKERSVISQRIERLVHKFTALKV